MDPLHNSFDNGAFTVSVLSDASFENDHNPKKVSDSQDIAIETGDINENIEQEDITKPTDENMDPLHNSFDNGAFTVSVLSDASFENDHNPKKVSDSQDIAIETGDINENIEQEDKLSGKGDPRLQDEVCCGIGNISKDAVDGQDWHQNREGPRYGLSHSLISKALYVCRVLSEFYHCNTFFVLISHDISTAPGYKSVEFYKKILY